MGVFAEHRVLHLLGGLFALAGFLAWVAVAWEGISSFGEVRAQSDEGGRLMVWAVTGTLLMIVGAVLLQFAAAKTDARSRTPGR